MDTMIKKHKNEVSFNMFSRGKELHFYIWRWNDWSRLLRSMTTVWNNICFFPQCFVRKKSKGLCLNGAFMRFFTETKQGNSKCFVVTLLEPFPKRVGSQWMTDCQKESDLVNKNEVFFALCQWNWKWSWMTSRAVIFIHGEKFLVR